MAYLTPASRLFVLLLAAMTAMAAMATDMSLPALPAIAEALAGSPAQAQSTIGSFIIGFGAGQLIAGPLSDRIGRRPVMLGGILLFILGALGCAMADSIEHLIALRVLQGLGASVGRALVPAIVRDSTERQDGARMMSSVTIIMALAPMIAPIFGGALLLVADWRAIFGVMTVAGLAVGLAVALKLPETRRPQLPGSHPRLLTALRRFLSHPLCLGGLLVNAIGFGGMFAYVSGSSFVLIDGFGVPAQYFGGFFAMTATALMGGATLNRHLLRRMSSERILRLGVRTQAFAGVLLLALTLIGLKGAAGIAGLMVPMVIFVFTLGLVMPNATAIALHPVPDIAGLGAALMGFVQMMVAAGSSAVAGLLYDGTPLAIALSVGIGGVGAAVLHALMLGGETEPTPG